MAEDSAATALLLGRRRSSHAKILLDLLVLLSRGFPARIPAIELVQCHRLLLAILNLMIAVTQEPTSRAYVLLSSLREAAPEIDGWQG